MTDADGEAPDLDAVRELRLLAVLRDLVTRHSQGEAAELLGIGRKTIWRSMTSGRLTPHVAIALEQWLVAADRAALSAVEERVTALEGRLAALDDSVDAGFGALRSELAGLRESGAPAPSRREPRPAQAPPERGGGSTRADARAAGNRDLPWRPYPQLVTTEPEPGEERLYGEATAHVVAWRKARLEARAGRRRLERLDAELRMRELELVLIGDHELTLPPAVYPWDRADRRNELWLRRQALADVRADHKSALWRRRALRLLTLGVWRA
ncbi:MAG: hypothetical protein OXC71_02570 [Chloroflexi bacterium]|nr:hypothetical protein [Chloroflexota bacterium]